MFPTPSEDTVELSRQAIAKYEHDKKMRAADRIKLVRETGYMMFAPGRF